MTTGIDTGTALALQGNRGGMFGGDGVIGGLLLGGLLNGGNMFGGNRGGWGAGYGGGYAPMVGQAATSAVASEIVLNPAFQSLGQQVQTLSGQVSNNALVDQIVDGFAGIDAGITSVNQNISGTSRDTLNSIANLSTAQATGNFTTLSSINGLGRDVTAQANQNALQQLNSFNQLTSATLQGFNEVGRDSAIATSQLIAGQNAQNYAMAQCCCEIKQTVSAEAAATRALITDNRMADLTTQLVDAKNQISDLNQTNTLIANNAQQTSTILSHLLPFMSAAAPTVRTA